MASTKTWKRWTQTSPTEDGKGFFPKSKYGFTELLKRVGDWVETEPMPWADANRMNDAAKFWAYHHGKRVKVSWYDQGDGTYVVNVCLISHTRNREID